jgi:hypothetical protein
MTETRFVFVPTPVGAGKVLAICNCRGRVLVACEHGILEYVQEKGKAARLVKVEPTLALAMSEPEWRGNGEHDVSEAARGEDAAGREGEAGAGG